MKTEDRVAAKARSDALRAVRLLEESIELAAVAGDNRIHAYLSADAEAVDIMRRQAAKAKTSPSMSRSADLVRAAYLWADAAALCSIGRDAEVQQALQAVGADPAIREGPRVDALCARAEKAIGFAAGYLEATLEELARKRAASAKGAGKRSSIGKKTLDRIRERAERERHRDRVAAIPDIANDVGKSADYVRKKLAEIYGDDWDRPLETD